MIVEEGVPRPPSLLFRWVCSAIFVLKFMLFAGCMFMFDVCIRTDKPSCPEDLTVKSVESESVTIEWKPPAGMS